MISWSIAEVFWVRTRLCRIPEDHGHSARKCRYAVVELCGSQRHSTMPSHTYDILLGYAEFGQMLYVLTSLTHRNAVIRLS